MLSTKEPQWIAVNNNALQYFGGVPALVVCDSCKKYSKQVLEKTCRQALELGKVHYTFVKNTIPVVAEEIGTITYTGRLSAPHAH